MPDVALLEKKLEEATKAMETAETIAERRKAQELKEDLMRLKRVEQVYVSQLYSVVYASGRTLTNRVPFFRYYRDGC